jgi:hypothetical protein
MTWILALVAASSPWPFCRRCVALSSPARSSPSTSACCPPCRRPSARRWKPALSGGRASCFPASRTGTSCTPTRSQADPRRGTVLPRQRVRNALRHDPGLGNDPGTPRSVARGLGLCQGKGLPRHDHPQALRRPGVLRLRPFGGGAEAVHALRGSGGVGDGAQLAGPGRTAAALRHRGTEGLLPAAPGQGPGDPGLRADQPAGRLGCRLDSRPRHRLQGPVAGQGSHRHARHLGQALHHARADLHPARPRLPPAGPGRPARRPGRTSASPARWCRPTIPA